MTGRDEACRWCRVHVQGWLCRRLKYLVPAKKVTSTGPRFDRQRDTCRREAVAVAEAPEMTVQDAVIPAFPRGSFFV